MEVFVTLLTLLGIALVWVLFKGISTRQQASNRLRALSIAQVDTMTGIEFEHYAAALLGNEGFKNVKVTPPSGDNGVDIVAERAGRRYAIQAKRYKGTVSRRAVSDAVAGMRPYNCNACMVITSGHLSTKALAFAANHNCEVVDRDLLADWIMRFQTSEAHSTCTAILPDGRARDDKGKEEHGAQHAQTEDRGEAHTSGEGVRQDEKGLIAPEVICQIKDYAGKRYHGDYSTIEYVVREQINNYRALRALAPNDIRVETFAEILSAAATAHPADYSTQLYVVNDGLAAFRSLQQLDIPGVPAATLRDIIARAAESHPYDFSTQLYVVQDQARAFTALERMGHY